MATFKPKKPKSYDGERDKYKARAWIFQMKQYLDLVQVGNPNPLPDVKKISFASTYFFETASTWWYTKVASNIVSASWTEFETVWYKSLFHMTVISVLETN